jgi:hypothetical protein
VRVLGALILSDIGFQEFDNVTPPVRRYGEKAMKIKAIAVAVGAAALVLSAVSARADDYVYGTSVGIGSGNELVLTVQNAALNGGAPTTVYAPIAENPDTPLFNPFTGTLLTYSNSTSGWYTGLGFSSGAYNTNYVVGNYTFANGSGEPTNFALTDDYVAYDMSEAETAGGTPVNILGNGTTVLSATEDINTYDVLTASSETIALWDVNTPISEVVASDSTGAAEDAIYTDLDSGVGYGTQVYTAATSGLVGIGLNTAAVTDIQDVLTNGLGDADDQLTYIEVGTVDTTYNDVVFGIGHSDLTAETIGSSVPLPQPLMGGALLMSGLAASFWMARRRVTVKA